MFTVSDLYEIRDGKLIDRLSDESPNATGHVEGECIQCKHRWRLRGNPLQKAYMKSEDQD
jgi:hypothetical protein